MELDFLTLDFSETYRLDDSNWQKACSHSLDNAWETALGTSAFSVPHDKALDYLKHIVETLFVEMMKGGQQQQVQMLEDICPCLSLGRRLFLICSFSLALYK